jgi:1,4-alpha-glucan branching enzyme
MSIARNDVPAAAPAPPSISAALSAAPASSAPPARVLVRFALRAKDARRVAVAGTFNNWNATDAVLASSNGGGVFTGTFALPPGDHEYMFVVDGRFVTDPNAGEYRPDGFGNLNALLRL